MAWCSFHGGKYASRACVVAFERLRQVLACMAEFTNRGVKMFGAVALKIFHPSRVLNPYHFRSVLLLLFVCTAVCSRAETPSPALFAGTVSDKVTGAPVRHAHVMYVKLSINAAAPAQPSGVATDSEGRFSVRTAPGSYRLWVEHPGYAAQPYGSHTPQGSGAALNLAPGAQIRDVEIQLTPLGAISGTILDEEGDPVQGVGVQVLRFSYATGQKTLIPVAGTSSDDRGHYRVYDLPAGRYMVLATPRGTPLLKPVNTAELVPRTQTSLAPLFYPGVVDPAAASEVSLAEGAEASGVEFRLPRIRDLRVHGRVLMPVEDPSAIDSQVVLVRNDVEIASAAGRMSAMVNKSGYFEFNAVAPGSYLLVATAWNHGRVMSARMPLEVSPTAVLDGLTLSLVPAFSLAGRLEVDHGAANPMRATITLNSVDHLAAEPSVSAKVAADGRFHLPGLTPGPWGVSLDPMPSGFWIKSIIYGDSETTPCQLNIVADPSRFLAIVLAANGARISGNVTGSEESAEPVIILAPVAEELRGCAAMYRVVTAREHGSFEFKDVRPGTYRLFAFQEVAPFAWLDPEVMKPIESLGTTITVEEGANISRQLPAIPPEALLPEH